jgi:hypothetical protein
MQDERDRSVLRSIELHRHFQQLNLSAYVQKRRGLIQHQDRRILGHRHREPGTLPLSAGERVDFAKAKIAKFALLERALDRGFVLRVPLPEESLMRHAAKRHKIFDQESRRRRRTLSHVRHAPRQRLALHRSDVDILDTGTTANGFEQTGATPEQR